MVVDPLVSGLINRIISASRSTYVPAELVMRALHVPVYQLRPYHASNPPVGPAEDQSIYATH